MKDLRWVTAIYAAAMAVFALCVFTWLTALVLGSDMPRLAGLVWVAIASVFVAFTARLVTLAWLKVAERRHG